MKKSDLLQSLEPLQPSDAPSTLGVLLVEDEKYDARAIARTLERSELSCDVTCCIRAEEAIQILEKSEAVFDVIVSDLLLPGMNGLELCLKLAVEYPDHAIVILTGQGSEIDAVRALKAGAADYIIKDPNRNYLQMLPTVLSQAALRCRERIARKQAELDREKLIVELREALEQVKTLRGIIPICSRCKNIRDDKGYWHQVEIYIRDNTDASFTHGICVNCISEVYPDDAGKVLEQLEDDKSE